jgi:ABC-type transport system involved in multi-copper enzyme maturation permease subunit
MLLQLIKKEIVSNVLSSRFMVTFVLFFGLLLVSMFVMTNDYKMGVERYSASVSAHREDLEDLKAIEDPQEQFDQLMWQRGVYSDRRSKDLSIFAKGLEDHIPSQVHTSRWISRQVNEEFYRNPLFALFSTPDFAYIVNIVVSLLAILFVFDTVCGEKERGTLKLMLSNSVPRDSILIGKWIGGYVSLVVPFLVTVAVGLAYVRFSGAISLGGENLSRLVLMLVVSLLFVSLCFTLGLLISTLTHKSSTSLLVALFVWVIWILVIPNLSPVIAKAVAPVPTLQKINAEKEAVDREIEIRARRISRTMLSYGEEAKRLQEELEQERERRKSRLDDFHSDKLRGQIRISKTISRISPSASFKYAATGLAETGTVLFERFKGAYARFEGEFRKYGDGLQEKRQNNKLEKGWFNPDQIPRLSLFDETLRDSVNAVFIDVLLMVIYNVLFFMGAFMMFLRYDAR